MGPTPTASSFSVSDLAEQITGPADQAEIARVTRRLRHLTTIGALDPLGERHTGAGRHRRYGQDAVLLAAILVALGDMGLTVAVLKQVAVFLRGLTSQGSPSRPIWEAALAGTQVILGVTLAARADRNAGEPQVYLMSLGAPEHFAAKIGEIGNATAMLPSEPRAKGILLLDLLAVRENH